MEEWEGRETYLIKPGQIGGTLLLHHETPQHDDTVWSSYPEVGRIFDEKQGADMVLRRWRSPQWLQRERHRIVQASPACSATPELEVWCGQTFNDSFPSHMPVCNHTPTPQKPPNGKEPHAGLWFWINSKAGTPTCEDRRDSKYPPPPPSPALIEHCPAPFLGLTRLDGVCGVGGRGCPGQIDPHIGIMVKTAKPM
jgi:hypothetical protein